jgi:hypothetical protein
MTFFLHFDLSGCWPRLRTAFSTGRCVFISPSLLQGSRNNKGCIRIREFVTGWVSGPPPEGRLGIVLRFRGRIELAWCAGPRWIKFKPGFLAGIGRFISELWCFGDISAGRPLPFGLRPCGLLAPLRSLGLSRASLRLRLRPCVASP